MTCLRLGDSRRAGDAGASAGPAGLHKPRRQMFAVNEKSGRCMSISGLTWFSNYRVQELDGSTAHARQHRKLMVDNIERKI